ncbi:MAG: hypothetical protein R2710_15855 [Acidimicrobiales bacterium]
MPVDASSVRAPLLSPAARAVAVDAASSALTLAARRSTSSRPNAQSITAMSASAARSSVGVSAAVAAAVAKTPHHVERATVVGLGGKSPASPTKPPSSSDSSAEHPEAVVVPCPLEGADRVGDLVVDAIDEIADRGRRTAQQVIEVGSVLGPPRSQQQSRRRQADLPASR